MICCKQRSGSFLILTLLSSDNSLLSILEGVYTDEKVLVITNLFTEDGHRSKGYATRLLNRAIWEARRNKINRVELDDCTDAGNDFYVNRGFQYVSPGYPEMLLELEHIPE